MAGSLGKPTDISNINCGHGWINLSSCILDCPKIPTVGCIIFLNLPRCGLQLWREDWRAIFKWVFPKMVGFPPKSSIFSRVFPLWTIHFGVPLFLETPKYTRKYIYFYQHPPPKKEVTTWDLFNEMNLGQLRLVFFHSSQVTLQLKNLYSIPPRGITWDCTWYIWKGVVSSVTNWVFVSLPLSYLIPTHMK